MLTSATGRHSFTPHDVPHGPAGMSGPNQRNQQGFTLVELMATLAIIGLATGAVLLTLPETTPDLDDEAVRLSARLSAAREEAVMTNRAVAIEATATGYTAHSFDGTGWNALTDGPFRREAWVTGTRLSGDPVRVAFDPTGMTEPTRIVLTREKATAIVTIDSAGEVRLR